MTKVYRIKEYFYSLQGEGVRKGTPDVFVRFAGCNLQCRARAPVGKDSPGFAGQGAGFDCDTDWTDKGQTTDLETVVRTIRLIGPVGRKVDWVLFTGGEPTLQLDEELVVAVHAAGFRIAVETNGTGMLPPGIRPERVGGQDWVCVSPKTPEDLIVCREVDEVKYVVAAEGQLPNPRNIQATHKVVSPAFIGNAPAAKALDRCIQFVLDNPSWRLSVQDHKMWGVR